MIDLRRANVVLVSAAALLTLSLSMPASAETSTYQPGTRISGADVPTPRVRPAAVRKRTARHAHYRLNPYRFNPPYERIASRWPILFVGIGW